VEDRLTKQGFPADEADPDDAVALLQAASVEGRLATRGGRQARRTQRIAGQARVLPALRARATAIKRVFADGIRVRVHSGGVEPRPPTRVDQVLYHGMLAANAGWRREVVLPGGAREL
jgi:hypothetical protein